MIIKKVFHTYKEDFPFLRGNQVLFDRLNLDNLFKNLILELSELSTIPKYCYITRHTDDMMPTFWTPTVWFVIYSETYEIIESIRKKLEQNKIKYLEDDSEIYDSVDSIPPDNNYTTTKDEAITFPKFLHQVTQIAIGLLKNNSTNKLNELNELEWMQGNESELGSKIEELREHLINNSKYYLEKIKNTGEEVEFWINFKKVYINQNVYSWPHFLFNLCGVISKLN